MRKFQKIITMFIVIIAISVIMKEDITAKQVNSNIFPESIGMKGQVTTTNVNIRTSPDLASGVITKKNIADVMVTGEYEDWYRIAYNNTQAWMSKEYVQVQNASYIPEVPMLGEQIVAYGKKFIGTPYVWGGTSLSGGVDCSGFTQGIYREFDININRTSNMQALHGKPIDKQELKSGDLIFFDTSGVNNGIISHVGVYAGDGEFIHSNSSKGITLSKLDNSYYKKNYVKSVRLPGI